MMKRTPEEQAKAARIMSELSYYTGSEGLTQQPVRGFYTTDGIEAMIRLCEAQWLVDLIISHVVHNRRMIPDPVFQIWKLTRNADGDGARATVGDGRGPDEGGKGDVLMQIIPYTDFPLDIIKIYVMEGEARYTMMLPTEY